jgi:hypothetical protein
MHTLGGTFAFLDGVPNRAVSVWFLGGAALILFSVLQVKGETVCASNGEDSVPFRVPTVSSRNNQLVYPGILFQVSHLFVSVPWYLWV